MANNKWSRPDAPPPPAFLGKKERDFAKQITDELIEGVIGQQIVYYAISMAHTNFHPLYGESMNKTFLPPIRVYALVSWKGETTETKDGYLDKLSKVTVHFSKRRLTEDQDLYVREGDFVKYGDRYYEIVDLNEPKEMFGQTAHKVEITANCIQVREGMFFPGE